MYPTPLSHAANDEVIPVQKYFTATASQTQITVNQYTTHQLFYTMCNTYVYAQKIPYIKTFKNYN